MIKENLNLFLGNGGLAGVNRPEKLFKLSVSCLMPQAPNCRPEVMNNMFFGFLEQAIHETYDLSIEKGQKSLNSKLKERDKDPVMPLTPEDLLLILAQFQFLDAKTISSGGSVDKDISGASAIRWFVKTQPKERQDTVGFRLKLFKQGFEPKLSLPLQLLLQQRPFIKKISIKRLNVDRLDKDMLKDIIPTLGRNEKQDNINRIISDILSQVKISNLTKGLFSSENVNMVDLLLSQIIEKINIQLKEGKDEITIRLKPEVLGRLKIKVGWDQGMLKVNFFATTHIAKQALEQNLNILSQMLLQQGLPVGEMSVLLEPDGHAPNNRRELVRYPKRIGTITHFVKSVSPEVPLGKDNSLDILA